MAMKFNIIPLVMYGEHQTEYGNILSETNIPTMDKKFFSGGIPKLSLGGKSVDEIIKETNFKLEDFTPYIPPRADELLEKNIQVFHLIITLNGIPRNAIITHKKIQDFKANTERTEGTYSKYASIDDKIDNFHYYTTLIKFGIGRTTYDAAQEIRNDKITREEGVALVNKFDREFPKNILENFLEYININEGEFHKIIDRYRSPHFGVRKIMNGSFYIRFQTFKDL